jgi:hypothetical protein
MKAVLYIVWQCTWGILQTLLGAIFFLNVRHYPHTTYRGCIDTKWNSRSGLSLGLFIFTPRDDLLDSDKIRVHEYGHCVQSLVLGPLYLLIGIVSLIWARNGFFIRLRREKKIPYTSCFVEAWASKWGELATGQKAIWN